MNSTKERVLSDLAQLSEAQLQRVAEFVDFLKFRERRETEKRFDNAEFKALYAEFSDEDHELAETDLADYAVNLEREDRAQ